MTEINIHKSNKHNVKIDGKVIGVQDGNNLAFSNDFTPDSPLLNSYITKKPFTLYRQNSKMSVSPIKGAREYQFHSVDQVYEFGKAVTMQDIPQAEKIYKLDPAIAKKHTNAYYLLGRQTKNFNKSLWETQKEKWMKLGMEGKFGHDEFAKKVLTQVSNLNLLNANAHEHDWSIGKPIYDDFTHYDGANKMGKDMKYVASKLADGDSLLHEDRSLQNMAGGKNKMDEVSGDTDEYTPM